MVQVARVFLACYKKLRKVLAIICGDKSPMSETGGNNKEVKEGFKQIAPS